MANERQRDSHPTEPHIDTNDVGPPNEKLLESFSSYTTLHGFHFVFSSDSSTLRRVFWVILMLAGFAGLLVQIHTGVLKLQAHESVTSSEIRNAEKLVFPAISICNMNFMKKSKIVGTEAQIFLDQQDPLKWSSAKNQLGELNASFDIERAVREYGHDISTMVYLCLWQSEQCWPQNFSTFISAKYGLCHAFNSGRTGHRLLESFSFGLETGLALVLNAEPHEYYGPYSYFGTGFCILVHDQREVDPIMTLDSHSISPGYNYEVKITRRRETHILAAPYKSECGERQLQDFKTYSFDSCLAECYTNAIMKNCGCRTLETSQIGGTLNITRYCSPAELQNCSFPTATRLNLNHCDCPRECKEVTYESQMSSSEFPSEQFLDAIIQSQKMSENDIRSFKDGFRKAFARVIFFYENLQTEVTTERPAYTLSDLWGDIGGNMGLFLGCSVITFCEFLDLIIRLCLSRIRRGNKVVCINTK